jgi:hypothetical protein
MPSGVPPDDRVTAYRPVQLLPPELRFYQNTNHTQTLYIVTLLIAQQWIIICRNLDDEKPGSLTDAASQDRGGVTGLVSRK